MTPRPLRLLIVDDSPLNRRLLASIFDDDPDVDVIGAAADGEEALRLVHELSPDAITLDLEMPRMDGFTFLRLLFARRVLPVLVISSYAQRDNVLRALELGALDFVAKPEQTIPEESKILFQIIREKVHALSRVDPSRLKAPSRDGSSAKAIPNVPSEGALRTSSASASPPRRIVFLAAGTGGPAVLFPLWDRLSLVPHLALVIAQRMPEKFTKSFADRLHRRGAFSAKEAEDGDLISAGSGFVSPGGSRLTVAVVDGQPRLRVWPLGPPIGAMGLPHLPELGDLSAVSCADLLFASAAKFLGPRAIGVVLTGMGADGSAGARLLRACAAPVFVEDPAGAVVPAMPLATLASASAKKGTIEELGDWIARL